MSLAELHARTATVPQPDSWLILIGKCSHYKLHTAPYLARYDSPHPRYNRSPMWTHKSPQQKPQRPARYVLIQRRVHDRVDALRPHRWNWQALARPIDRGLQRDVSHPLTQHSVRNLRFLWLDGLFSSISENFYLGYVTLFALAFGATNGQVGLVTAAANLMGAISLFPGARLIERRGWRKPIVLWSAGGLGRLVLLGLAVTPFLTNEPALAILLIVGFNGLRAFMAARTSSPS